MIKNSDLIVVCLLAQPQPGKDYVYRSIINIRFKRIWRITHNTIFADITILMFSKKLRTKLSMNGVLLRFRQQKNSTWNPAKLNLLLTIQPGQNWANLKSQTSKNLPIFRSVSPVSPANFTYTSSAIAVNGNFIKFRSPRLPSRPTYQVGPQRLAIFWRHATGFSKIFSFPSENRPKITEGSRENTERGFEVRSSGFEVQIFKYRVRAWASTNTKPELRTPND